MDLIVSVPEFSYILFISMADQEVQPNASLCMIFFIFLWCNVYFVSVFLCLTANRK